MTSEELYWHLREKYLCWNTDFNTYTNRDRLRPVLKPFFIKSCDGTDQIKLEYYQDISCKQSISSEYLDAGLSDRELLSIIDAQMRSDKWFEMPECFTGEGIYSLSLPVGFIKLVEWAEETCRSFNVVSAGYGTIYEDADKCRVSTETVFDLCLPTEQLDVGKWYELLFVSFQENGVHWQGFPHKYTNKMSLVLTGVLGNWSFGISAYNTRFDPQLRDSYEVRYSPDRNGFLFRVDRKGIDKIWLKVAWLKSESLDGDLCQQALRHWLE